MVRYPVASFRDLYLFSHPDAVKHVLLTNHFVSCPLGGKKLCRCRYVAEWFLRLLWEREFYAGQEQDCRAAWCSPSFIVQWSPHKLSLIAPPRRHESWANVATRGESARLLILVPPFDLSYGPTLRGAWTASGISVCRIFDIFDCSLRPVPHRLDAPSRSGSKGG